MVYSNNRYIGDYIQTLAASYQSPNRIVYCPSCNGLSTISLFLASFLRNCWWMSSQTLASVPLASHFSITTLKDVSVSKAVCLKGSRLFTNFDWGLQLSTSMTVSLSQLEILWTSKQTSVTSILWSSITELSLESWFWVSSLLKSAKSGKEMRGIDGLIAGGSDEAASSSSST